MMPENYGTRSRVCHPLEPAYPNPAFMRRAYWLEAQS